MNVTEILAQFGIDLPAKPFGNGHINTTYRVGDPPQYILQKINTDVFRDPATLMENLVAVTGYLREKIASEGEDPSRRTLTFLPAKNGEYFYRTSEGECWRVYRFIGGARSYENAETPALFAESARAFGHFQKLLSDFPAEQLHEIIPHFHDTGDRLRQLREAIAENRSGRAGDVQKEIAFCMERAGTVNCITSAIAEGSVPLRVTHNDTKLNNVLLDDETGKGICVIDLDTIMPGSLLYDYGDSLRFGASTGAEDERDLSKISFDLTYFEAYTDAFLAELGESIRPREVELLPMSARLMTFECGIRFLADHINGDVYFRIHREGQNLDRARTQFCLVEDMERKDAEMRAIVARVCGKYGIGS